MMSATAEERIGNVAKRNGAEAPNLHKHRHGVAVSLRQRLRQG